MADGQAETGTSVAAGGDGFGLGKGGEQTPTGSRVHADAGILHRQMQAIGRGRQTQNHLPTSGELHRIPQQIDENLSQPSGITLNRGRQIRIQPQNNRQTLGLGPPGDDGNRIIGHGFQVADGLFQNDALGLGTAVIEHVINNRQQRIRTDTDRLYAFLGRPFDRHRGQEVGHTDDPCQGRP